MATMKVGITVSCGRDNLMNNPFKIKLSPKLPGDPKPKDVEVDFPNPPTSAEDVAKKVAAAVNAAGGKASAQSQTQSTGSKGGKPTTTDVCLITITGLDSMDVRSNDGKVRWYEVNGNGTPTGGGSGGGAGGGLTGGGGTQITDIDCEEYRKKVKEEKEKEAKENAERARKGKPPKPHRHPNPGTETDWFCHPDHKWKTLALLGGMPPLGNLIVGTGDIAEVNLAAVGGDLLAPFMGPTWIVVPFRVIAHSLDLQYFEIRMRLASAGIVTSNRNDGVIQPLRFIEGRLGGQEVRAFGFATPYDPLGYAPFPWTMIVGTAEAVAQHLAYERSARSTSQPVMPLGEAIRPPHTLVPMRSVTPDGTLTGPKVVQPDTGVTVPLHAVVGASATPPTAVPHPGALPSTGDRVLTPQAGLWTEWARARTRPDSQERRTED